MRRNTVYSAKTANSTLVRCDVAVPDLKAHDVLIEITHCGVCHSDVHFVDNDWGDSQFPMVPGHEIVGRVIALGDKVHNVVLDQRVAVSWQQGACLHCEWCEAGKEVFCHEI
ncbi:MAG: alcohol dehydrogenase catalytic domain-containing protein, partial [Candidatus Ruthia sp.]|nr:alcohol dehydrogenase catalytic domain-containing protein [Candidatus Ruthturnera sp.]